MGVNRYFGGLLAGLMVALPSAWAGTIPVFTGSVECSTSSGLTTIADSTTCSQAGGGEDNASISVLPFVVLSAFADSTPGIGSFTSFASLEYSFEVVGGNPGDQVHLLIQTDLDTSSTSDAVATAEFDVTTSLVNDLQLIVCSGTTTCTAPGFAGTVSVAATSGTFNTVSLAVEASAGFTLSADQFARAGADPLISIDPSFDGADNYSILLSDGVGNGIAPAPEPGTLLLMCIVAPALLFARRWRQQ